jgi:Tfp pilus assembly protein PilN
MRRLGLELTASELRIVRAERRFGTTRLVSCARVPCPTPAERRSALTAALAWRPHLVVAALPLSRLAHRFLTLPFRDSRRVAETITLELVGQLPADPGEVAAGHRRLETSAAGSRCLAAVARRAHVDALTGELANAGARAVRVEAALLGVAHLVDAAAATDAALVLADGERSAIVRCRAGAPVALRALGALPAVAEEFAAEVRWTLAALGPVPRVVLLGAEASPGLAVRLAQACGVEVAPLAAVVAPAWRAPELAACAVAAGLVAGPGLVLHETSATPARPRRVAALAVAAAALVVLDLGLVRWRLERRDAALGAAIEATAAAALPSGTRLVAPRAQLEAAAAAHAARPATPGHVLGLLRELTTRLPTDLRLELDELTIEGDVVRLHGRTDRFEAVDAVTRALAGSSTLRDVVAEDSRAAPDGRGIGFAVRAIWRPALGAPS